MISVAEALSILDQYKPSTALITKDIEDCLGYRLAADLVADLTLPPYDASAMDGYAVKFDDAREVGDCLKVIGDAPAGSEFEGEVQAGQAVRVFTGSRIPSGSNHVVIQENVERLQDTITITKGSGEARHIRRAGIDFQEGDRIASKGQYLTPPNIALAAAANYGSLPVYEKPRIAILAAGDELVAPGHAQKSSNIVNSNTAALTALIKSWGGIVCFSSLAKDDPDAIKAVFQSAKDGDIIVPVGGASVGAHDYMRHVFEALGGEMIFERIAVKPGKPTWFGLLQETPVLGLPGNPATAIVCAHLFLRPLMKGPKMTASKAMLMADLPANGPRETYVRGRMSTLNGYLVVNPLPQQDTSLLTPFRNANVLIRRAANAPAQNEGRWADVRALGTGPSMLM